MATELRVNIEIGETDGSTVIRSAKMTSLFSTPGDEATVEDCDMWLAQVERVTEEVRLDLGATIDSMRRRIEES